MLAISEHILAFLIIATLSSCGLLWIVIIKLTNLIIGKSMTGQKKTDAIAVLGCKTYFKGRVHPRLAARVRKGIELANDGVSSLIIFSGGRRQKGGETESVVMNHVFQDEYDGSRDMQVILENKSRSTYENLLYLKSIMKKKRLKSVTITTDPFHVSRTYLIAKKLHIPATIVVSSDTYPWLRKNYLSRFWFREIISLVQHALMGRI